MKYIFWFSILMLFYTYIGYPLYIFFRARYFRNIVNRDYRFKPYISVIMSAYNEEANIERKIKNLLGSDYPKERLEILVGSDGSTDDTNKMLSRIAGGRVKVFIYEERRGKPSVLNNLVPKAAGEVLIFCDVRQAFDNEAVSRLISNFADGKVGCASGELVFENAAGGTGVADGVGLYWEYEKLIRKGESDIHSMVGATGAIYAIRKELCPSLPADVVLDDVYIPLSIARTGFRCIFDEEARAYDRPAVTADEEYRRKVRTLAGNYQIFAMFRDLLIPFRSPVTMPLVSHKLLRVLAPIFLIALFISNIAIAKTGHYASLLIAQAIFYMLAMMGAITAPQHHKRLIIRIASVVYMFCFMNLAALVGLYRFLRGTQRIVWEK